MRTPMHWSAAPGGGFTEATVTPWLPLGDTTACNVEDQIDDPDSILVLTRDLLARCAGRIVISSRVRIERCRRPPVSGPGSAARSSPWS